LVTDISMPPTAPKVTKSPVMNTKTAVLDFMCAP
jgi:hypothetical protein